MLIRLDSALSIPGHITMQSGQGRHTGSLEAEHIAWAHLLCDNVLPIFLYQRLFSESTYMVH